LNPRERGFLLLADHLGDPNRKVLTAAQLRTLAQRMHAQQLPAKDADITLRDILHLGYGRDMAVRILTLLNEEERLDYYLRDGRKAGCIPVTRVSDGYPLILRKRLGLDSPGCLWVKGDISCLNQPGISLVGSRDLAQANRSFAKAVGYQAATQGLVLISGNARGADRTAQDACLEAGGTVISVVADALCRQPEQERVIYVSEDGFDKARCFTVKELSEDLGYNLDQCGYPHEEEEILAPMDLIQR